MADAAKELRKLARWAEKRARMYHRDGEFTERPAFYDGKESSARMVAIEARRRAKKLEGKR